MTPDALATLHAACFTTPRPWKADEFVRLLGSPGVFLIVEAQCFALGRVLAGEAELLTLAVAPGARRQGTGRNLLRDFETEAHASGAETAFLEVAADNSAALALYISAGWIMAGRRPGYYRTPEGARIDATVLRKSLTDT